MRYINEDEIIGYETDEGFLCSSCFHDMQKFGNSHVSVITPAIADEFDEVIICDNCADVIWGIDRAQPF